MSVHSRKAKSFPPLHENTTGMGTARFSPSTSRPDLIGVRAKPYAIDQQRKRKESGSHVGKGGNHMSLEPHQVPFWQRGPGVAVGEQVHDRDQIPVPEV